MDATDLRQPRREGLVKQRESGSAAVRSRLDPFLLHRLRAQRLGVDLGADGKLALLRRLGRGGAVQFERYTETRVEQSWNEQIFRSVFDYQTMFSHGTLPFHLLPKNVASGQLRYDDFSLGFFGEGSDQVIASAELKGWGQPLSRPQSAAYEYETAVTQAFGVARSHSTCRWVLVSNFAELHLYEVENDRGERPAFC